MPSICLSIVVLLCGGLAGVSAGAGEPLTTGSKRDTLIYVRTAPSGAEVTFNGRELGTSDGLFRVDPGNGTLCIKVEGHQPEQRQIIVRANFITRVELSLQPQTKTAAESDRFVARFPQGEVELLGITNYPPTVQSQWWKPDGSAADRGPFLPQPTRWSLEADRNPIAFLLRLDDVPDDASWPAWHIEPSADRWGSTGVLDVNGEVVPHYHLFCAELGPLARTADLRVGLSMGGWDTVITQQADQLGTSSFSRDGQQWKVTFIKAEMAGRFEDDSTRVRLTSTGSSGKWNKRLVAVTDDGSEHAALIGSKGEYSAAVFDRLPLDSIKEFRFQVRPYDWVEFKDVSLCPDSQEQKHSTGPGNDKRPDN